VTLAAILVEQDGVSLEESYSDAPEALKVATLSRMSRIHELLESHPETRDAFHSLESTSAE
jgi:hypothetical protein